MCNELQQFVAEQPSGGITFVGEDFPGAMVAGNAQVSVAAYLRDMYGPQGKPPFTREPHSSAIVVNLRPHHDGYALRALLASAAERVALIAAPNALPSSSLIESKYRVDSASRIAGSNATLATFTRLPVPESNDASYVLRYIVDHRQAKLSNAWREALISWRHRLGEELTKNQAREAVAETRLGRTYAQSHLSELPSLALRELAVQVEQSMRATGAARRGCSRAREGSGEG